MYQHHGYEICNSINHHDCILAHITEFFFTCFCLLLSEISCAIRAVLLVYIYYCHSLIQVFNFLFFLFFFKATSDGNPNLCNRSSGNESKCCTGEQMIFHYIQVSSRLKEGKSNKDSFARRQNQKDQYTWQKTNSIRCVMRLLLFDLF